MFERVRRAAKDAKTMLGEARVKAMDQIVSILANREVDTSPRAAEDRGPVKESDAMKDQGDSTKEPAMPPQPKPAEPDRPKPKRAPTPQPSPAKMAQAGPRPDPRVETEKVEATPPKSEPDYGIFAALPPRYASHRLALIARDPRWAFAYWDVDRGRGHALFEAGAQAVLRLHDANDGRVLQSPRVHAESGRYYYHLPSADQRYQVTLTAVFGDGHEVEVLRSNVVLAPPELPRPGREPRFVSMKKQIEVLEQARQIAHPPSLVDEEARRLSIYPTPSIAGQTLTLLPTHEKPRAAPVEEGATATPSHVSAGEISDFRAILSGSESVYIAGASSSAELLRKKDRS